MRTVHDILFPFPMILLGLAVACEPAAALPANVFWESAHLGRTKARSTQPDEYLRETLAKLRRNADAALGRGPYSVMQKSDVPPSGDKHDYLSFSRYWWPNPETGDGLPYIRRDGQTNAAMRARGDRDQVGRLIDDVETLALAYYYFDDESCAKHASRLIRTWFLDPDTRMNPNLNYGQGVLGRTDGRGVGIIDTRGFILLLESTALVVPSEHFSDEDLRGLKQWFKRFLTWLRTSKLGVEESLAENNHGSWYAAQVARIALFVDDEKTAREVVEQVRSERIARQFRQDGSQPEELDRTRSLHYSLFNLAALSVVARVGEHLGTDLWHAATEESGGMEAGLAYVIPHARSQENWPHPQMARYKFSARVIHLLRMASIRFNKQEYRMLLRQVDLRDADRNYASLVCAALPIAAEANGPLGITVTAGVEPAARTYELPDISGYSIENIRKLVPASKQAMVTVGRTAGEKFLDEIFRKERGTDLQSRQGTKETRTIRIEKGVITVHQLVQHLDDKSIATEDKRAVTLRLPILIQPGATLIVDGRQTGELRLSTDCGSLIANAGTLFVLESRVISWNEQLGVSTPFAKEDEFRPFIASYIRSRTYLAGSTFQDLGYHAPTAYGLSLSSQPERDQGEPSDDWPTGQIVGNVFRGLFYGFYSYEARDIALVNNTYVDNIRYGIDPHDRSTRLIIAKNTAKDTRERHGIIGSRGITNSFIFDNTSVDNTGSGIMLDRQCSRNVIAGNHVYRNGQGIALYESPDNLVDKNIIFQNAKSGIRVRNSTQIVAQNNVLVGNGDYGFEAYTKRLDDHDKRVARGDLYVSRTGISIHGNTVTGNEGGCLKGSKIEHLCMSGVHTDLDLSELTADIRKAIMHLDVGDDHRFGGELKQFSSQLRRVFEADKPIVEMRSAD